MSPQMGFFSSNFCVFRPKFSNKKIFEQFSDSPKSRLPRPPTTQPRRHTVEKLHTRRHVLPRCTSAFILAQLCYSPNSTLFDFLSISCRTCCTASSMTNPPQQVEKSTTNQRHLDSSSVLYDLLYWYSKYTANPSSGVWTTDL